jgi:phosphoglycerate dehydrogenase-like enzyme
MATALLTDADRFPFTDSEIERLRSGGIELIALPGHGSEDIVREGRAAHAVFVFSAHLDTETIAGLEACRIIMRCGSGYDRIDVAAARRRGIVVSYVPDYGTTDVAEHALALLLACARRVVDLSTAVRAGEWPTYNQSGSMHRLRGRTLGLIGFGRIARAFGQFGRALGMRVVAYDPYAPSEVLESEGVQRLSLAETAAVADVISLHAPLTAETENILSDRLIDQLPHGAIVINAGRGELIDQAALERALASGRLAGAGLDVLRTEPPAADSRLLTLPNVVITPHSAAFTDEALDSLRSRAIDEVIRVLAGQPPQNPVPELQDIHIDGKGPA